METQHGRRERIGVELDCSFCEMPELPPNLDPYKRTPDFDEGSLPEGLRKAHTTKAGVWATIEVGQGRLEYTIEAPTPRSWILRPGVPGVVEPQRPHRVRPIGSEALKVHVQFWRLRQDGNTTD